MLIAVALSLPLSWYAVSKWLEGYPVRIDLSMWLFMLPSLSLLILLSASVIVQVYRGAKRGSSKGLKGVDERFSYTWA